MTSTSMVAARGPAVIQFDILGRVFCLPCDKPLSLLIELVCQHLEAQHIKWTRIQMFCGSQRLTDIQRPLGTIPPGDLNVRVAKAHPPLRLYPSHTEEGKPWMEINHYTDGLGGVGSGIEHKWNIPKILITREAWSEVFSGTVLSHGRAVRKAPRDADELIDIVIGPVPSIFDGRGQFSRECTFGFRHDDPYFNIKFTLTCGEFRKCLCFNFHLGFNELGLGIEEWLIQMAEYVDPLGPSFLPPNVSFSAVRNKWNDHSVRATLRREQARQDDEEL